MQTGTKRVSSQLWAVLLNDVFFLNYAALVITTVAVMKLC